MASFHTNTSLKSVKKNDLIELYMDIQGKWNNSCMCENETVASLSRTIKGLQEDCEDKTDKIVELEQYYSVCDVLEEDIKELKEENKKLKEDLKLSEDKVCELTHENIHNDDNIICSDCKCIPNHRKTKWTYITGDTDTNLSIQDNIWCCNECLVSELDEKDEEIKKLKEEVKDAEDMVEQYSQDADRATEAEAEVEELKEEVKENIKYCEISTIIADMECQYIYEYAEKEDAKRLCELGWADKDDFPCLRPTADEAALQLLHSLAFC